MEINDTIMMVALKILGIPKSLVTKDSRNPAMINRGTKPSTTFAPFKAPFLNDTPRGKVPGKSQELPMISPAPPAITMEVISIVPWIQIVRTEVSNKPLA